MTLNEFEKLITSPHQKELMRMVSEGKVNLTVNVPRRSGKSSYIKALEEKENEKSKRER